LDRSVREQSENVFDQSYRLDTALYKNMIILFYLPLFSHISLRFMYVVLKTIQPVTNHVHVCSV